VFTKAWLATSPHKLAGTARGLSFAEFAGNERKTSGSRSHTPDSLVQWPARLRARPSSSDAANQRQKPRCRGRECYPGLKSLRSRSGIWPFLSWRCSSLSPAISPGFRARTQGESEPSPLLYQHALRDVIGRMSLRCGRQSDGSGVVPRQLVGSKRSIPGKPLRFLIIISALANSLLGNGQS